MSSFKGKTALITGGAGAIGSALAVHFIQSGMRVAIADLNIEKASDICARYGLAGAICFDALNVESCAAMLKEANALLGRIDFVIHAVSRRIWGTIAGLTPEEWEDNFNVNFYSLVNVTRAAAPYFKEQNHGNLLHISGKSAKYGLAGESACTTAMFACRGHIRSMAYELAPYHVRANTIIAGDMPETASWQQAMAMRKQANPNLDLQKVKAEAASKFMGRTCTFDDIANMASFLLGEEAAFVTGQAINLTGGQFTH